MERRDAPAQDPSWVALSDEELLRLRICDLGVTIPGSEVEPRVQQLHEELAARGLRFRPEVYLGDEWFSPEGVAAVAVPFYLAHPRLKSLERNRMMEVEGGDPEYFMKLLRHECGHALDHAYGFSKRPEWTELFGSPGEEYAPEYYRPRPYSKSFVRNLDNWYAQSHPDEDFAETFAVWLGQPEWRTRYRRWKALEKLEYVDQLMREIADKPVPRTRKGPLISQASKLRKTLERHYAARRRLYAEDFPDFYDADLRAIFSSSDGSGESAARFMRRNRAAIVASIVRWTGQPKYTVAMLVRKLILRCQRLELPAPRDPQRIYFELAAYLATLVTNHLHTGRFKRIV